ncbi:hypothetical protein [Microbacterium gorillae]|uniref:hypothetical protein n=1 Tax=Microbacterium gorillae TaxID=1231063 RepID=UPI000590C3BB|nr:hypothetical protein [Microbacterium gorillae]
MDIWGNLLKAVPAITAAVAIASWLSSWWRTRTWTSLEEAEKVLRRVAELDSHEAGVIARESAAAAAQVLVIELATRAQERARRVAHANGGARLLIATAAEIVALALMALAGVTGFMFALTDNQGFVGDSSRPVLLAYFGGFAVICVVAALMIVRAKIRVWRATPELRGLYRAVAAHKALKVLPDELGMVRRADPERERRSGRRTVQFTWSMGRG